MQTIKQIAKEINKRSKNFNIGKLQEQRAKIKNLSKQPGEKIFNNLSIFSDYGRNYAFHLGGRKELQFNIGVDDEGEVRHGVAFSLERSQSLPDVTILYPKIDKFNEYMKLHSKEYSDMELWWSTEKDKNKIIPEHAKRPGTFIFFGKFQDKNSVSYDEILKDFDRLLPLYIYVESKIKPEINKAKGLVFLPVHIKRKKSTKVTKREKELDIELRHNLIEEKLFDQLVNKYGEDSVGDEQMTVSGNKIDIVVMQKQKNELIYYEIKTAPTAKSCIREALSQLLEYSYWPGGTVASRLVIASESSLDNKAEQYLKKLRQKFLLPIYYEQVKIN